MQLGGLHIIGTERHEARRIDNQLRGRGGRQGDPGSSQFFVSLEDDLMRIFGSERIKKMMEILKVPEDQPIENKMISRAIESAQAKIEGFNFDTRKHVLEYDDVMNKQRQRIYSWRKQILEGNTENQESLRQRIIDSVEKEIRAFVEFHTQNDISEWNFKEIFESANAIFPLFSGAEQKLAEFKNQEDIINYLTEAARQAYEIKEKEVRPEAMRQIERFLMLRTIDVFWMDHLDNMDHLRDSVRLRAYGQKDPLVEYKNEGHSLFQRLIVSIEGAVARTIYKVTLAPSAQITAFRPPATGYRQPPTANQDAGRPAQRGISPAKLGRNDPCWCGSEKKFKKCHMNRN